MELTAVSWIGWIVVGVVLAVVVVAIRGLVELASWLVGQFLPESSEARRPRTSPHSRKTEPHRVARTPESKREHVEKHPPTVRLPVGAAGQVRRTSRLGRWWKRLKTAVANKSFDYWVAAALSEDEPEMKIEFLSKALGKNPDYLPAWGMKGNALLALGRCEEAIQCFDKSLERHPSALTWKKKGDCCHRLHRPEEALRCFHKAMETCPDQDPQLRDDIAHTMRVVESELRGARAS